MAQGRTVDPEAHVAYLRARHTWNKRTRADIEQAIQLLRRAIDADPAYCLVRGMGYDVDEEIGHAHLGPREYDHAEVAFERVAASGAVYGGAFRNPLLLDEMRDRPRFQAVLKRLSARHP